MASTRKVRSTKADDIPHEEFDEQNEPDDDAGDVLSLEEIVQSTTSKHIRDLRAFFTTNTFVTEKGSQRTNIVNAAEKRSYFVPPTHIDTYFALLDACRRESRMIHYAERQETDIVQKSGIMIDFDCYQHTKDAQITPRHFESLNRHLAKIIRETLVFTEHAVDDQFSFHIFYIRKPSVALVETDDGGVAAPVTPTPTYKDGMHVLIPELQVTKGYKRYLCNELVSRGVMKTVFKDIEIIGGPDTMLDKMSPSVPVHFFGNSKRGRPAYTLTNAYRITLFSDDDDIERREIDVAPLLAGTYQHGRSAAAIPVNLTYELSLSFFTNTFGGHPTWLVKRPLNYQLALESKIQVIVEKAARDVFHADELLDDERILSITNINNPHARYVLSLLRIMDIKYATEYKLWFETLCAIAHCGSSEDYKNIAREFSRRKPDTWSSTEFERVWTEANNNKYKRAPLTLRSIQYWARTSSPQAYREVDKENYGNVLRRAAYENAGRVEQASVAKLCKAMCGDKFVVDVTYNEGTNRRGYCWFEFVIPGQSMRKGEVYKWRKECEPDNIHLFISEQLPKIYAQVHDNIKEYRENAENDALVKYWKGVESSFKLYQSKLGNDTFQSGCVRQAQYQFRQRGFAEELDSYEDVIGVGNGVLKLGVEPQLIKGFHEYKISKFTETDYEPYDPENPRVKILMGIYRDIFIEPDVLNYMLMHASTGLDNEESACILTLLVAGGQNGKTAFAKMMHNTLGNMYCAAGKPSLLTAPMERGESANSAQMQQRGKRWFYIDEFNKCEVLNTARVKAMVTPGWQSGRDLHERQANFKNTSNTVCYSNFDFIVDTTDHGTWRRIYYYKNKMSFRQDPNPDNPFEKKVDPRVIDVYPNDPLYLTANLSILVHYNTILRRDYGGDLKNVPVPTIDRETEVFRNRQDALNRFITQMMVVSPKAEAIGLSTLASRYIEWYNRTVKQTNQSGMDVQAQFENSRIASAIERRGANVQVVVGYRVKLTPEEPIGEDESEIGAGKAKSYPVTMCSSAAQAAAVRRDTVDEFPELRRGAPVYTQLGGVSNIINVEDNVLCADDFGGDDHGSDSMSMAEIDALIDSL
jgi:hypothetical protein